MSLLTAGERDSYMEEKTLLFTTADLLVVYLEHLFVCNYF